jgi:hypothetical protein
MPEPVPPLRYQLLPPLRDAQPGNPVLGYLKCFMEQERFFSGKESVAERERLLTTPLGQLPATGLLQYGGAALRQADYAARLETADWQALVPLRHAGMGLLIPDVQHMRTLAAALKVRFRAQVAARHFDDAVRTAQTIFAVARHLGEHPTLVGNLVGISISHVAMGPLDEMIGQPGCPNLYWALSDLPAPLVDIRKGLEGDRAVMLAYEFSWLDEAAPMDEDRLEKAVQRFQLLIRVSSEGGKKQPDVRAWIAERARDTDGTRAARQRLIAAGLAPDAVQRFPVAQVILLDERREFELRIEDSSKLMLLPYWQMAEYLARRPPAARGPCLFGALQSALGNVRRAQARMEQRLAMLRAVEALRLYAAEHGGRWPAKLGDVAVPLSPDPVTGRQFAYECDGNVAHLRGTPPAGQEKNAGWNVHYVLTVQK